MRALTVLNVAYPFAPVGHRTVGGAEQVLSSLDTVLSARGHRSLVLACEGSSAAGTLFSTPLPDGPLDEPTRALARERFRARLWELLAREQVDVVHMHGVDFHAYLPPRAVPTLVTLHLPLAFYRPNVLREAADAGVALTCVSAAQRRDAPPTLRLLPDVPNGVPLDLLAPRADVGDYLLVLSRICPEKGIHLALDVARALDLPAIVAGRVYPYPEHERYFAEEVAPRLDAKRRYVGAVAMPAKAELLARARALLVPSLVDETSSLVSMEALAAGTPVVAFRRGALPEVIEHGRTGFVVGTVEGMIEAVRALAGLDRGACRRAAEARFCEQAMADRYLALYLQLRAP